jgi:ATP-binding cassette, subfamily B, bacterial
MNPSPLSKLFDHARDDRPLMWRATIASIANKLFDIAPEVLIGIAVDIVVNQKDSFLARYGIRDVGQQLIYLAIVTVAIWGMESLSQYIQSCWWRNLAQNLQHRLRMEGYGHLQKLEMGYFEENTSGNLIAVLNDDVNQLERFLDSGANEIVQLITSVIVIGIAFFVMAPQVAWWSMIPIPFIIFGSIWYQGVLAPYYGDVRDKAGNINSRLANNLSGIATIKSFTAEGYELDRLAEDSEKYRRSNAKAILRSSAFVPLIRMLVLFGFTATLLYGGLETVNGRLGVGIYSVLVYLTQRLLWPLTRLGETLDRYQRAMASTNRILKLLATPIAIDSGSRELPQPVTGEIVFDNIGFSYPQRQRVIDRLSLQVPAGKTIAIVGSTGSGKSTLVKLLLRFYEVTAGSIYLDGCDLRELRLKDLRSAIGLVSQDVYLFDGSVRENIAYGRTVPARDDPLVATAEIVAAAKIAEAHEFIDLLPQGYDTIVGERGQKLSGGQRQRIAIARAILKNPPILILDEATSAVDNETEAAIQRSLARITENRTTIAIAHRLSTIRHAHCIYVMENGTLVESGTHEELLADGGIYTSLWQVQSGL